MVGCSDVYISFNKCENTVRYSFISHLSAAFHRRGMTSFIGEDGSDSESNEFPKLEDFRASVVVFSEKYSSSKTRMEELVKVSKRRLNNGLVVVPVFYPVTKSFVKKQIWKLGDVYKESALLEIIDLPGHELYDRQRFELSSINIKFTRPRLLSIPLLISTHFLQIYAVTLDFVEDIVADVREKLNMTDNIGIYSKLRMIETLLNKQPWGVRSIGLWGMAGIGKTLLLKLLLTKSLVTMRLLVSSETLTRRFMTKDFMVC